MPLRYRRQGAKPLIFAALPKGELGRDADLLFPCFLDLFRPQRELRGGPPPPPTLSKNRSKLRRKCTSKKTPFFKKMEPNGPPLGPEILPKSIKSQTKALEALITKNSEKQLEKVSLQTPPGPLKSCKFIVGCVKNRRSLNQVFLDLKCPS